MRFKKGVHTLASAVLLSLCAAVPAFATFAPVHSVVFGPERNNYDDSLRITGISSIFLIPVRTACPRLS